jgi:hypothetical protein
MAELQTVKKILSPLQIFTLCNSLGIILKYTANDIHITFMHEACTTKTFCLCSQVKVLQQITTEIHSLTGAQFGMSYLQTIPWSAT